MEPAQAHLVSLLSGVLRPVHCRNTNAVDLVCDTEHRCSGDRLAMAATHAGFMDLQAHFSSPSGTCHYRQRQRRQDLRLGRGFLPAFHRFPRDGVVVMVGPAAAELRRPSQMVLFVCPFRGWLNYVCLWL